MSTPEKKQWPFSHINTVLLVCCLAVAVVSAVMGAWPMAIGFLLAIVLLVAQLLFSHRDSASDLERVNSLEFQDERDKEIAVKGLAAVGVVALVVAFFGVIGTSLFLDLPLVTLTLGIVLITITVTWIVANWYFTRH